MHRSAFLPLLLLATASAAPDDRSFMIGSFDRLRIDGPFEVTVVQGAPKVSATGDRKALEQLSVRVNGTTLAIGGAALDFGEVRAAPARITVQVPALQSVLVNGSGTARVTAMRGDRVDLAVNGAGTLAVDAVQADSVNISLSGTGLITLAGKAAQARVRAFGGGGVDGGGFTADEAVLVSETTGGVRMGVRYRVQVSAMSTGAIEVIGTPECRVRGTGPVTCSGAGAN